MPHLIFMETQRPAPEAPETRILSNINLPDSPAIRAEVSAMLLNADPPARGTTGATALAPRRRIRAWLPRWVGWLRAMPMP